MIDKRKNEIWAMLDTESQTAMSRLWHNTSPRKSECRHLENLFGKHNLANQIKQDVDFISPKAQNCENFTKNGVSGNELQTKVDWTQYRLDLTKEIAIAVISSDRWDFHSCNPVRITHNIIKQLKEDTGDESI